MKNGFWEDFEWTFDRIREAYEKVAKDEIWAFGHSAGHFLESTDFLRRIIAPSLCRMFTGNATVFPCRTTFGGFLQGTVMVTTERRSIASGGVRLVEANTKGERSTGYWLCRPVPIPMKRRFSKARSAVGAV